MLTFASSLFSFCRWDIMDSPTKGAFCYQHLTNHKRWHFLFSFRIEWKRWFLLLVVQYHIWARHKWIFVSGSGWHSAVVGTHILSNYKLSIDAVISSLAVESTKNNGRLHHSQTVTGQLCFDRLIGFPFELIVLRILTAQHYVCICASKHFSCRCFTLCCPCILAPTRADLSIPS